MNVLSLFDGISCGRVALDRLGIPVDSYYASEVCPKAIKIAQRNYIGTMQLGDVSQLTDDYLRSLDIDLLIGGSPCQGFSIAGKRQGCVTSDNIDILTLEHYLSLKEQGYTFNGQSYLFWEYIRVMRAIKPAHYLLENVKVLKKWIPIFNHNMGVLPYAFNSKTVSAQSRPRLYWTNIRGLREPKDKGIKMLDILESSTSSIYHYDRATFSYKHRLRGDKYRWNHHRHGVNYDIKELTHDDCFQVADLPGLYLTQLRRVLSASGKSGTLLGGLGGNLEQKIYDHDMDVARKLTPLECERLQTLPDNYTKGPTDPTRYSVLGNGWTVDIIAHILKEIT